MLWQKWTNEALGCKSKSALFYRIIFYYCYNTLFPTALAILQIQILTAERLVLSCVFLVKVNYPLLSSSKKHPFTAAPFSMLA